jgi:hypothetical protein
MIEDADGITEAFSGTALAGYTVQEGPGRTFVVPDIDPDGLLQAWRAARSAVPATGRSPVLITTDFADIEDEVGEGADPADLDDLDVAARTTDPWVPPRGALEDDDPLATEEDLPNRHLYGFPAEVIEEVTAGLSMPVPERVLHRWIYDRLLAEPALAEPVRPGIDRLIGTTGWFVPESVQLVLLPTGRPWLSPYWLGYFGSPDATWLSAVEKQWHDRWGAEVVASWGTMLQFVAGRRPAPGDPAWELAGQLKRVGGSLQMPRWMLALALPHSDTWFLHHRP